MRKVFFSFDWDDVWRVNQVRNSWVTKGSYKIAGYEDVAQIEKVRKQTDEEIKKWINRQMRGSSVTCVLIGNRTEKSKWVEYEIKKSIRKGNGLLGILVHNLKDSSGETAGEGKSPLRENGLEVGFGKRVENALLSGGEEWGLSRVLLPHFALPLTVLGAALRVTISDGEYQIYDWEKDNGCENFGEWIEKAAKQVGK